MTEQVVIDGFVDMSIVGEDNLPDDNPITDEGATLGRVLFYDRQPECKWQCGLRILPCTAPWVFRSTEAKYRLTWRTY